MADISSMTLLNGDVVNLKDSAAREAASSAASGLTGKVDKAQGVQNTGKILKVGSGGILELVDPTSGSGDVVGPNSATDDHVATFDGTTGKLIQDSGFTIGTSVPSDAVFTDTTYESLEPEVGGTDESLVTTGEKAEWNAKADLSDIPDVSGFYTKPVTGIPASDLASGVIPDISGKADLDENGKVPSSQLPSYVDDVLEYADLQHFPLTGESGKIYIAQDTNKTYRWSGSTYAEISESLALGETSSTAYRGDRGADAYTHAITNKGSAFSSGMYKITTNSEGHVTAATAVEKSDITGLGIPAQDTTYNAATQSTAGLMSSTDKTKLDGIATGATANTGTITEIKMNGASKGTSGVVDLGTVITAHQDISGKVTGPSSATNNAVAIFDGTGGKTIKNSGFTIGKSVPSNAAFTDTTYTFDGTYNASTNKAATVSTVTNAINALDGGTIGSPGAGKTLTALSQTNGNISATFGNISITKSQISDFPSSMTPSSHTHGNIQNGGGLQTNDITIANGDKLVVTDSSNSSKVARTSVSFDGSTTTKCLTQKGTWASFTNNAGTITGITMNGASKGTSGVVDLGTVITNVSDRAPLFRITRNCSQTSLANVQSKLLEVWGGMDDNTVSFGYASVPSDSTSGLNGGIGLVLYARNTSGVYVAVFLLGGGKTVTDYYYSSAHHWAHN